MCHNQLERPKQNREKTKCTEKSKEMEQSPPGIDLVNQYAWLVIKVQNENKMKWNLHTIGR